MLYGASLGLEYLHERQIVHGDLKLNNILVGSDDKARLTDFGLSGIRMSSRLSTLPRDITHSGGGLRWRAPECASRKVGFASDIYSFGMCIIEAATGLPPFSNIEDCYVLELIGKGVIPEQPNNVNDEAWDLVIGMTRFNPNERLKINHVVTKLRKFANAERSGRCIGVIKQGANYCQQYGVQQKLNQRSQYIKEDYR
jgi:serine/threonine protein kinase